MKPFRIRKNSNRRAVYIADAPIILRKPKFPKRLFLKVNKPGLYERRITFELRPDQPGLPVLERLEAVEAELEERRLAAGQRRRG